MRPPALPEVRPAGAAGCEVPWRWPLDLAAYDRAPTLHADEGRALAALVRELDRGRPWPARLPRVLERLFRPVEDALAASGASEHLRTAALRVLAREMHPRGRAYWGWTPAEWVETLGATERQYRLRHRGLPGSRQYLLALGYLLGCVDEWEALGPCNRLALARKVFGRARVDAAAQRVVDAAIALGYRPRVAERLRATLYEAMLATRSPRLEDLTAERLAELRRRRRRAQRPGWFVLSQALFGLGLSHHPPRPASTPPAERGAPDPAADVAAAWLSCCQRWRATSTLPAGTRAKYYRVLLMAGRWVTRTRPEAADPACWTRALAAECVAAVDRMVVGQWAHTASLDPALVGKPLSPKTKDAYLTVLRAFFRDLQEWGWIPRRFTPRRDLATPRAVRALVGPDPRVIADDRWAKLLWAGLNLAEADLVAPASGPRGAYPLAMVRALAVVWLFAGLRRDEIRRLRLGCIRWQRDDVSVAGTGELLPQEAICLLDVPVHKTGRAFTKPVDRLVGEAIRAWERARPAQPALLDPKTGELVQYLFAYRGRRIGEGYLNTTLIPALCQKAGIPERDARGAITSHRARSTIATQLFNAREPLSLFELQAWLGHSSPQATQHYARIAPTRLAKAYADAGYFARNVRAIEVLIDRDAVQSGAAATGAPWRFYDLGHGYCTYDFFDQCPHRMACAKCAFYRPKGSTAAQLLEGRANLLRLQQEIPLTDEERAAVEEGLAAHERLLAQLADVPTPAGPTPRELGRDQGGGAAPAAPPDEAPALIPLASIRRQPRKVPRCQR